MLGDRNTRDRAVVDPFALKESSHRSDGSSEGYGGEC